MYEGDSWGLMGECVIFSFLCLESDRSFLVREKVILQSCCVVTFGQNSNNFVTGGFTFCLKMGDRG